MHARSPAPRRFANHSQGGYISLMTVIVVGAVSASIATSLVMMSVGTSRSSAEATRGAEARALANACVEAGLQLVWNNPAFTGSGALTLGNGSCAYTVISATVTGTGMSGTSTRRVTATIAGTSPAITLSSWQETP